MELLQRSVCAGSEVCPRYFPVSAGSAQDAVCAVVTHGNL